MKRHRQSQSGFTLVELSIVLVIIGLIIGGVLTGQQIMQNARVTNMFNSIQAYQAQFQTYTQNYGALPGDDAGANVRFPAATPGNGDGNGSLKGTFDSSTATDETRLVWAQLRAAGLLKNQLSANNTTAIQPPNPFNGIYGFQDGAFNGALTATVLCLSNIPAAAAEALDSRLDDGVSNTGSIQSVASTDNASTGTPVANYGVAQTYTMCIRM